MRQHHFAPILALAVAMVAAGCGKSEKAGCKKDTDCKGERVCEKGKCVGGASEKGAKTPPKDPAAAKAALKGATAAPSKPGIRTPGSPIPSPGTSPSTPPRGGTMVGSIQVCLGPKCVDLGGAAGTKPQDLMAVFGMLQNLMMSGLSGMGGPKQKLRVCVRGQCVTLDKGLLKNPMALLKLFSQLSPNLLQKMFNGMVGRRHGYRGQRPHPSRPPRSGAAPRQAPPSQQTFKSFDQLRKAGGSAVGRVAELAGLSITSVSDSRLVLEGPGKEMIVLKIPTSLKSMLPKLRITTQRVTVKFRVLSRPIGKLLHGQLVSYN